MTPKQFAQWRAHMGLSKVVAADMLGVTRQSVSGWEAGRTPISKSIELACAALTIGIRGYPPKVTARKPTTEPWLEPGTGLDGVLAAPFTGPPGYPSS